MSPVEAVALFLAGFGAGAVNAVAGGGSLISFPTLIATGLPALTANVTNTVAIWPGYLSGTLAFRPELEGQGVRLRSLGATCVVGAIGGAALLLLLPDRVFRDIVPWLVLLSSLLLAAQPRIAVWLRSRHDSPKDHRSVWLHVSVLLAAAYGAYFGGGLGVILLAVLGIFLEDELHRVNALKSALSLVVNTVALVAFVTFGPVSWPAFAVLAPASFLGGTAGARLARRLDATILRAVIVALGLAVAAALLIR
jgi:uncharacterized membrane protein YfcA